MSAYTTDYAALGLSPLPGVNAFTQSRTPKHSKAISDSERLVRQRTYDAHRRMKLKALRVNPTNEMLAPDPKGFAVQAAAIRQEIAKTKEAA